MGQCGLVYNANKKAGGNSQPVIFSDQWYATKPEMRSFAGKQPRYIPTYFVCTILYISTFINLSITLMFGVMTAEAYLPLASFETTDCFSAIAVKWIPDP